jgi:hypothetical protein
MIVLPSSKYVPFTSASLNPHIVVPFVLIVISVVALGGPFTTPWRTENATLVPRSNTITSVTIAMIAAAPSTRYTIKSRGVMIELAGDGVVEGDDVFDGDAPYDDDLSII